MSTPTLDPDIVIVSQQADPPETIYERVSTGQQWIVRGTCNQCGLCVIGAVGAWYQWVGDPGTPGASVDTRVPARLDDPITPELIPNITQMAQQTPTATVPGCSTTAEYI